jgi:hypothetical protein
MRWRVAATPGCACSRRSGSGSTTARTRCGSCRLWPIPPWRRRRSSSTRPRSSRTRWSFRTRRRTRSRRHRQNRTLPPRPTRVSARNIMRSARSRARTLTANRARRPAQPLSSLTTLLMSRVREVPPRPNRAARATTRRPCGSRTSWSPSRRSRWWVPRLPVASPRARPQRRRLTLQTPLPRCQPPLPRRLHPPASTTWSCDARSPPCESRASCRRRRRRQNHRVKQSPRPRRDPPAPYVMW